MGKPRVLGNNAKVFVSGADGKDILVGEIDKFMVKDLSEVKKSRPLGQKDITSQLLFMGYDLEFEGGKVDWQLASVLHSQQKQIFQGGRSPYFKITERTTYMDGTFEQYRYDNVTIHGYDLDMQNADDQLTEKFLGFCGTVKVSAGNEAEFDGPLASILAAMSESSVNKAGVTDTAALTPKNAIAGL